MVSRLPTTPARVSQPRYAITSMPRGRGATQDLMAADARDFDLLDLAPGQGFGLYFWKRRH